MRNIFFVRFLALILCSAMICEITALSGIDDVITAEADVEMEHEESKEKEKEKTTEESESIPSTEKSLLEHNALAANQALFWNNPLIDFQTPPPELS